MRRTSDASSAPTPSRCCRTGATSRSATTAARARSSSAGRPSCVRPGRSKSPDEDAPRFGPSRRLDIELELGFVVGVGSRLGEPVPASAFRDHVFGVVLVNDWSARDIQAWEYQPLGPFLGKSFATSIAAWVTPLALLEDRFVAGAAAGSRAASVPPGRGRLGARRRARGRAVGDGRLADERARPLLDDAAAARARDRERRVDPHGRPVRVGDDLGPGARDARDRSSSSPGTASSRCGSPTARSGRSSRMATRSCSAGARATSSSARCAEDDPARRR